VGLQFIKNALDRLLAMLGEATLPSGLLVEVVQLVHGEDVQGTERRRARSQDGIRDKI
jgi:hypothetical protein